MREIGENIVSSRSGATPRPLTKTRGPAASANGPSRYDSAPAQMTQVAAASASASEEPSRESRLRSSGRRASERQGPLSNAWATKLAAVVLALVTGTAMLWIGAPPAFASSPPTVTAVIASLRANHGRPARDGDGDQPRQSHLGQVRRHLGHDLVEHGDDRHRDLTSGIDRDRRRHGDDFWRDLCHLVGRPVQLCRGADGVRGQQRLEHRHPDHGRHQHARHPDNRRQRSLRHRHHAERPDSLCGQQRPEHRHPDHGRHQHARHPYHRR